MGEREAGGWGGREVGREGKEEGGREEGKGGEGEFATTISPPLSDYETSWLTRRLISETQSLPSRASTMQRYSL